MKDRIGRVTEAQIRREMLREYDRTARRRARIAAVLVVALAFAFGALAARFLFRMADVRTDGMARALQSGDVVLCQRTDCPLPLPGSTAARGALALVRYSENGYQKQAVRRVIALPGDEVTVEADGHVAVNGEALEEPYAAYRVETDWGGEEIIPGGALENPFATEEEMAAMIRSAEETPVQERVNDMDYPLEIPDDMVFVLCDNREDLLDSRSSRFGLVKQSDVLGLARVVIWPAHRAGTLLGGDTL